MCRVSLEPDRWAVFVLGVASLLLSASCKGGSSADTPSPPSGSNRPPVIAAAKFMSDPISLVGPVALQIDAEDPEREAVTLQFKWYVDNALLPDQTGATLPAELLRRGQAVMAEITPADGTQKGQPYRTKVVVVGNTPPKVTAVSLLPQAAQPGVKLEAQVEANDPDHDRVDLIYKWFRNDAVVKEGEEPLLDTSGFAVSDRVAVEVTAHDPAASGGSLRSDSLILGNSPPKIVSAPPASVAPDRFEYPVRAVDSDGDRLSYQLEAAPPGMTIGEESGQIAWQIPSGQHGTFHVKVVAKDGRGGIASQEFDLSLTPPVPAKPAGA